ncbi:MAG: hypothetical protein AAFQ58_19235 [Pseudomonadota bacterium]
MARISRRQFTFANGEVSPSFYGRADMEFFFASLARGENVVIDQRGIIHRRPGTEYITHYTAKPAFYNFLDGQSRRVLIIALPTHFEFLVNDGLVQDQGTTFQLPHTYGADYDALRMTADLNINYISHPNHVSRSIALVDGQFQLAAEPLYPYDRVNTDEACTLFLEAGGSTDATEAFFSPISDPVGTTFKVRKQGDNAAPVFDLVVDELLGGQLARVTITPPAADPNAVFESGSYVNTVTGKTFDAEINFARLTAQGCARFTSNMVGQNVRYLDKEGFSNDNEKNTWVTARILSFVSTTEVEVAYSGPELTRTDLYQLPLLDAATQVRSSAILDERIWLAYQNQVIGSQAKDFYNWDPTDELGNTNPDNAIYRRIAGGSSGQVSWLAMMGRQLVVGTKLGVHSLLGSGVSGAFQADATAQQRNERIGCADREPIEVGDGILFISGDRRQVYRTQFAGQYDQVAANDQTLFADHLGQLLFSSLTYQEHPYSIAWAATDAGVLLSHSVLPGQGIQGWLRHRLGGFLQIGEKRVAPRVTDVGAVDATEGDDKLYLSVHRTLGQQEVYTVEGLGRMWRVGDDVLTGNFLDCSLPVNTTVEGSITFSGVAGTSDLSDGRYAATDGDFWVFGDVTSGVLEPDTPNTDEMAVPGRDYVSVDGGPWALLPAAGESGEAGYVHSSAEVFRSLIEVKEIRQEVTNAVGFTHMIGDEVTVFVDGHAHVRTVGDDGEVGIGGAVARVGLSYDSIIAPLPFRANLGSTDGANDPVRVIEGAVFLGETLQMDSGSGQWNDHAGMSVHFEPTIVPDRGAPYPLPFTGWQQFNPFADLTDNDRALCAFRFRGPYPARVQGLELTLDAHGGR